MENILQRQTAVLESLQERLNSGCLPGSDLAHRVEGACDNDLTKTSNGSGHKPFSSWSTVHRGRSSYRQDLVTIPPLTIPLGHQTGANSLFLLPQVIRLIGNFPEDHFSKVEARRSRPGPIHSITKSPSNWEDEDEFMDRNAAEEYFRKFLELVYPLHPFFDRHHLVEEFQDVMDKGLGSDIRSGLFMAILALGATASDPISHQSGSYSGDWLVRKSLRILIDTWITSFRGEILLCQGLILCTLYFAYTVEPLTAWRLIHMASTNIQQVLIRCESKPAAEIELQEITRLSWVCFTIESDIQADFHQPRSGIELLVDTMHFPNYGESPTAENLYSLAEISVWLLQNRIHHAIYFTDRLAIYAGRDLNTLATPTSSTHPSASLIKVCEELNSQLETWYNSLSEDIKPDLSTSASGNRNDCLLRLRYWSSKQNIYRPFVIYVTSQANRNAAIPNLVLDNCNICLRACRSYILTVSDLVSQRSPNTYSAAQYSFTCLLLISLAAQCYTLRRFVEDVEMLQDHTINMLNLLGPPGSALECVLQIATSIATRQRYNSA
ncbi:hypothetical protein F5884DRAFT_863126 [Xylogone sp. PMI_703]|nr:hypothetical protein F5884DRAFT_863126 [Xylogone sp. PMI_703]